MKTEKIEKFIIDYFDGQQPLDFVSALFDDVRAKNRTEILASLLVSSLYTENREMSDKIFEKIKYTQLPCGGFDEKFYGLEDENVGSYGAITTSFIAISCTSYIEKYYKSSTEHSDWLIKLADYIYSKESNGYFLKGTLNRSKALNTDLFMAYALSKITKKLHKQSIRRRMFEECIKRTLFRVISYQFINGSFPYQSYTFKVPFIYHIVVTSIMKYFALDLNNKVVINAYYKGVKYIEKNIYNGNLILWENANDPDKQGATWAYSFLLNIFSSKHSFHDSIISNIDKTRDCGLFKTTLDSKKSQVDKFYSSWIMISLDMYDDAQPVIYGRHTSIYLLFIRQIHNITAITRYIGQKIQNIFFDTGAHENKDPHD